MSSARHFLAPVTVASATSLGAGFTSSAVDCRYLDKITVQVNVVGGGTASGTFTVQVSMDNVNFFTLSLVPAMTVTSGSPTVLGAVFDTYGWGYLQVVYTRTGGTGTATVLVGGKGV